MSPESSFTTVLLTPLHSMWRWIMPAANVAKASPSISHRHSGRGIPGNAVDSALGLTPNGPFHARPTSSRPLRIVRLMEVGQPSVNVGRMVISGRMADVCAELDRLVACEAALH